MHLHESRGRDYQKCREATWVAVEGYGHLAPGRVAMDEQRQRIMTEAAHGRLMASPESASGRQSPRQSPGQFLRHLLIVIDARLRQIHACEAAIEALRKSSAG